MHAFPVTLVCAAALLPGLAHAAAPPSPQQFGIARAIADYCSRIDPAHEQRFVQQARTALGNMSEARFAAGGQTLAYQHAYSFIGSLLSKASPADALRACTDIL